MQKVITISRQFGSGGHEIGKKLAEKLDIPFYDKTIAEVAASNIGIDVDKIPDIDEKAASSFMYSLSMGNVMLANLGANPTLTVQDRLFIEQTRLISEYAQKGSCVIVGRCADFILRDHPDLLKVFVCADFEHRLASIMNNHGLSHADASSLLKKTDRARAAYHQHYTDQKWGLPLDYDICLNTSRLSKEKCIALLYSFLNL